MGGVREKILILGNSHLVVFGFRGELIEELVSRGYDVIVAFPNGPFGNGESTSEQYGCRFIETRMDRRKTNPISDLMLLYKYIRIIKMEKPNIVLAYTSKCDVYGGVACRITNTPFIPNITGLGSGIDCGGVVSMILTNLYKIALKNAKIVFFQNEHDKEYFLSKGIGIDRYKILPGSGVNLRKFAPLDYPETEPVIFTYVGRVMKSKGIEEFLEAARTLKGKAVFHVCGLCEEDYIEIIKKEQNDDVIKYYGLVDNMAYHYLISHCVVLPTFHLEGISNVLLEAVASARPIITTIRSGYGEVIGDLSHDLLIEIKNSQDLIDKMRFFLSLSFCERRRIGLLGRKTIERKYDRKIVVKEYIKEIETF